MFFSAVFHNLIHRLVIPVDHDQYLVYYSSYAEYSSLSVISRGWESCASFHKLINPEKQNTLRMFLLHRRLYTVIQALHIMVNLLNIPKTWVTKRHSFYTKSRAPSKGYLLLTGHYFDISLTIYHKDVCLKLQCFLSTILHTRKFWNWNRSST